MFLMIFSRDIINVDLVNGLFKVKFDIRKLWYDPNVNFRNLKKSTKNYVLTDEMEKLWKPYVVFFNIESMERIEKSDRKTIMYIEPNPAFQYRQLPRTSLHNEFEFRGDNNSLGKSPHTTQSICLLGEITFSSPLFLMDLTRVLEEQLWGWVVWKE